MGINASASFQVKAYFSPASFLGLLAVAKRFLGMIWLIQFYRGGGEPPRAMSARDFAAQQFDRNIQWASAAGTGLSEIGFYGWHVVTSLNGGSKKARGSVFGDFGILAWLGSMIIRPRRYRGNRRDLDFGMADSTNRVANPYCSPVGPDTIMEHGKAKPLTRPAVRLHVANSLISA